MVNRPAGGARSKKHERSPYDWYVEPPWAAEMLFDVKVEGRPVFGDDLIWDPSCGRGTILDVAKARGHPTIGSDIIDRHPRHRFYRGNFLLATRPPSGQGRAVSIVNNPPYGYVDGIAEDFIRKALDFPVRRAAFIVPVAFLASETRYRLFTREFRPSHVCIYSDRPTMPPGALIEHMGSRAFKGGMADYVAIIFTPPHRWRTETIWLRPRKVSAPLRGPIRGGN